MILFDVAPTLIGLGNIFEIPQPLIGLVVVQRVPKLRHIVNQRWIQAQDEIPVGRNVGKNAPVDELASLMRPPLLAILRLSGERHQLFQFSQNQTGKHPPSVQSLQVGSKKRDEGDGGREEDFENVFDRGKAIDNHRVSQAYLQCKFMCKRQINLYTR